MHLSRRSLIGGAIVAAASMFSINWAWAAPRRKVLVYRGDGGWMDRRVWRAFQNGAPCIFDGGLIVPVLKTKT